MGCKYKKAIRAFYVSSLETSAKNRSKKADISDGRLFDNQHLSGMKIAGCLAIIPLQGCDGGVVLAGYAVEGVSALHLVQALTAGLAGATAVVFLLLASCP